MSPTALYSFTVACRRKKLTHINRRIANADYRNTHKNHCLSFGDAIVDWGSSIIKHIHKEQKDAG